MGENIHGLTFYIDLSFSSFGEPHVFYLGYWILANAASIMNFHNGALLARQCGFWPTQATSITNFQNGAAKGLYFKTLYFLPLFMLFIFFVAIYREKILPLPSILLL